MPDDIFGAPLPEPKRPSRKRQLADHHQRTLDQRIQDCLDYPLLYEMAELLPSPHMVGCPREYPSIVYLLMAALTPVTKSKRSTAGLLTSAGQWRSLRAAVRRHMGRRAAAALPLTAPTRGQYDYAVKTLLVPSVDLLEEEFRSYAAHQALEQGLFPASAPKTWSRPERRQLLVGDATVPKAPPKARKPETVDPVTGELRSHRVDPAARDYYENGEKAKRPVRGTKWFFGSGRGDGYWTRVILTFAHVAGGEYGTRQLSQSVSSPASRPSCPTAWASSTTEPCAASTATPWPAAGCSSSTSSTVRSVRSSTSASSTAAAATTCGATRAASPRASASTTAPAYSSPCRSPGWNPASA
ncbi:hypothetical protein [Streptomyces sp. NPDC014744]|uniref:hypothetical protein n=1 Tax=Streptomyces sp. NPDC014744 TaxID=3364903 RepID=UPI0036F98948